MGVKTESDPVECRFYERPYPEVDDVVMVNVTAIGEFGAEVTLHEYNNMDVWAIFLLSNIITRTAVNECLIAFTRN